MIDAFNADMPFDRFIREQIAGDLLPAASLDERRRQLVATTFLALGNTNLEEQDKKQLRMDVVDEQLDTIGKAFLAQTIGCARCHDHKFDPIPTRDYYALAGILRNTRTPGACQRLHVARAAAARPPGAGGRYQGARDGGRRAGSPRSRPNATGPPCRARRWSWAAARSPSATCPASSSTTRRPRRSASGRSRALARTYIGAGYVHDAGPGKGEKTLTFQPELPAGRQVRGLARLLRRRQPVAGGPGDDPQRRRREDRAGRHAAAAADRRPVRLARASTASTKNGQGYVLISNEGTKGDVIADAVLFIPAEPARSRRRRTSPGRDGARRIARRWKPS